MNWNSLKDNGAKLMNLAHSRVLTASGNRFLAQPFGMPLVELHTTGRKSGLPRSCYLTTPVYDSKRVVVVIASKDGDDRNPDWYRNLQAAPRRHSCEERPTARSPRAYRQRSRKGRVVAEDRCVS
jgi:deazaflavin-dependent oxidoreductase (nitroreductase family)